MGSLRNVARSVAAGFYLKRSTRKIQALAALDHPAAEPLSHALMAALAEDLDDQEREFVTRIESRREHLVSLPDPIEIQDFGAGLQSREYESVTQTGIVRQSTVGEVCGKASKPYTWSLILLKIIREFKPNYCIELGACMGISAAYQASAQKMNRHGTLQTFEGSKNLAALASETFNGLGLTNAQVVEGRFQDTLPTALQEGPSPDYAFIDGHHSESATLNYFGLIKRYAADQSLLIFDDINWSRGMRNAWDAIAADDDVTLAVDLRTIGIVVLGGTEKIATPVRIPLL